MTWYPTRNKELAPLDDQDIEYVVNKLLKIPEEELVRILECLVRKLQDKITNDSGI